MEILAAIVGNLVQYAVEPIGRQIGRQIGYLAHYKSNYQNLQTKLKDLLDARDEVKHRTDEVESSGKSVETGVQNWKTRVGEIITEADIFLKDGRHAQAACLKGFCPNFVLCYQLSKKSTQLVKEIVDLYGKKNFSSFAFTVRPLEVCLLSTGHYHEFDSRNSTMRRVMDELRNPNTEMILIWGIGGVGKTTLVEEVLRQATRENLFDEVVLVRYVKENPDLEKIQKEIATKLGMSIVENHTLAERAPRLCDRIKDKRILVALDDVWEAIDLVAVGLPRLVNCKVMLTSRSRKELSLDRRTQKDIPLDVLNEDEAWSLFEKMTGDVVKDSRIQRVAIEVAKKCGRLPILIVTIARALKDRNMLHTWKDTLRRLRGFDEKELTEKAYLGLEWSYDQLEDKELKPLFLLCGIIVDYNHICLADLFKHGFGLGLIKDVSSIEEGRDAVYTLVEKLKDSCLLLDSDINGHVRMHDLVCEVAIRVASRDRHILSVELEGELKEWPDKEFFKVCSMMSLRSSNIPMLAEVPRECPRLELIYLYSKAVQSVEIPSNYFSKMEKLKVLDFTKVRMLSLPSSLEFLKNLLTLSLEACVLEDVTPIGHLSNLEILSFARSNIKELPEEIGQLIRLRWLDLSNCDQLKLISPNVISRLERLEDLTMRNVVLKWEADRGGSNASLLELKDLSQLTALVMYIRDANILLSNVFSSKLARYNIYIGKVWKRTMAETTLNTLKLELLTSNNELDQGIITLLRRSEDLSLDGTDSVNSIVHQLHAEDFQQLIHLHLQNNVDFTYMIDSKVVFPHLTTMSVGSCDCLRFLFSSSMAKILVELKHLEVSRCKIMEEIVSTRDQPIGENIDFIFCKLESLTLRELPNLTRFCTKSSTEFPPVKKFETESGASIFDRESGTSMHSCLFDTQIKFPILERFEIHELGKLQTLWINKLVDQEDSFHRLREVEVSNCYSLINMFVPKMMGRLNALKTLWISDCHSLEMVFEVAQPDNVEERHVLKPSYCRSLNSVDIKHCKSLKNIFPASVVRGFQNLHSLVVEFCEEVKEIIVVEQGIEKLPPQFVFPKVISMRLSDLPKLCTLYPGIHTSKWPLLEELFVYSCDKLKMLAAEIPVFPNKLDPLIEQPLFVIDKDSFPSLEDLFVGVSEIWYGPSSPAQFFSKLKSVEFYYRTPFSEQATIDFFQELPKLAKLQVGYNDSTEVFVTQEINGGEEIHRVGNLSGVKTLEIFGMPKLLQLGNGNSQTAGPVFPNLNILYVYDCNMLKSVESSAISFRNLSSLTVYRCERLEYLTSHSVAKSLMQLTTLIVRCCNVLREIIGASSEDDHHSDDTGGTREIAFSRLQLLRLEDLPKLQGFCLGNCIVKLPSSTELDVRNCLIELKISSEGVLLSNPKPERIQIVEEV